MIESNKISLGYIKKLEYTGGYKGMRYMLKKGSRKVTDENGEEKKEDIMIGFVWPEPFCFAKTDPEKIVQKEFPLTQEGKEEAVNWLNETFEKEYKIS